MPLTYDGFSMLEQDFNQIARSIDDARDVLDKAAQPILDQMKQNAQTVIHPRSGDLQAAIGVQTYAKSASIGVHRKDWHNDEYYPAYVEFGHAEKNKKDGKVIGTVAPHPFIRPAIDAGGDEAFRILRDEIDKKLQSK